MPKSDYSLAVSDEGHSRLLAHLDVPQRVTEGISEPLSGTASDWSPSAS